MKETLEEAAERFAEKYRGEEQDPWYDFMEGAKWQQERSYSEEEVIEILNQFDYSFDSIRDTIPQWFKQIKSKQDE